MLNAGHIKLFLSKPTKYLQSLFYRKAGKLVEVSGHSYWPYFLGYMFRIGIVQEDVMIL